MNNGVQVAESWGAFNSIASDDTQKNYVKAVAATIRAHGPHQQAVLDTAQRFGIPDLESVKYDMMDLLLSYLSNILEDEYINEQYRHQFGLLTTVLKIQNGDFYNDRFYQVQTTVQQHIDKVMEHQKISVEEAFRLVSLQDMFLLSHEQYMEVKNAVRENYYWRSL